MSLLSCREVWPKYLKSLCQSIQFGILSGPLAALDAESRLSCLNTVLGDIEGSSKLVASSLFVCDKGAYSCCGWRKAAFISFAKLNLSS